MWAVSADMIEEEGRRGWLGSTTMAVTTWPKMVFQLGDCILVANHIIQNIIILCRRTFLIYLSDSFKGDPSQPYTAVHIRLMMGHPKP
jgi:hypothetical protein